jgi:hypothetical protein
MKKDVFGKGETVLIDRIAEKLPAAENRPGYPDTSGLSIKGLSDREYFYILRKIFHTFMFDMKEFAMDVCGLSVEKYINTLLWLTHIQSLIYRIDLSIEKQAGKQLPEPGIDLGRMQNEIVIFLREHSLFDSEIDRCLEDVFRYLRFEMQQIGNHSVLSQQEIFNVLNLKSADLEVLRRIILKINNSHIPDAEMKFFRLLDKIREVFDDIRDFEEDLALGDYNTVIYLVRSCTTPAEAAGLVQTYIEQEYDRIRSLADTIDGKRYKKILAVCARLEEEKKYYLHQVLTLAVQKVKNP